jgi:hypothetical protein
MKEKYEKEIKKLQVIELELLNLIILIKNEALENKFEEWLDQRKLVRKLL